jgi:hypothetical protein
VVHLEPKVRYASKRVNGVPPKEDLEMISSRDIDAELVKVFLHKEEKEVLKQVAAKQGIPVSHLMRSLALAWLEQNESA